MKTGSAAPAIKFNRTSDAKSVSLKNSVKADSNGLVIGQDESSPKSVGDISVISTTVDDSNLLSNFRVSKLSREILRGRGIETLFPIQEKTFDSIYDGKHVVGRARTGTGKTLALSLPTVESLIKRKAFRRGDSKDATHSNCIVLVLLPTRELAQQVAKDFIALEGGRYGTVIVVGGNPEQPQIANLKSRGNVVVGTPGRILDFLNRGIFSVTKVQVLILDEADQMLEMGFREDVDAIMEFVTKNPSAEQKLGPQILLFTATLPTWITSLTAKYMKSGEKVVVDIIESDKIKTALGVKHLALMCNSPTRPKMLGSLVAAYAPSATDLVIIFTETKAQANEIVSQSNLAGISQVIHGDIQQKQREITLKGFREGRFKCLIATDVAARGIHVDGVALVIHMEPPKDVDTFVHRSGRTGRAGTSGTNLVLFHLSDLPFLNVIEKKTGMCFTRIGLPDSSLISATAASQVVRKVLDNELDASTMRCVEDSANLLVTQLGATEAVSKLLIECIGFKRMESDLMVSVSTGRDNFKTYHIEYANFVLTNKSYVWNSLKSVFGEKCAEKASALLLTLNRRGAVFDISADFVQEFDQMIAKKGHQLKDFKVLPVADLPPLIDTNSFETSGGQYMDSRNPNSRSRKMRDGRSFGKRPMNNNFGDRNLKFQKQSGGGFRRN